MTQEFELEIIKSVLDGKLEAFETLVRAHEKTVYNLALRMTGSVEDAQDMTQETFIKVYRSLSSFRADSKFSVWIYRIASNVCCDFLRVRNRRSAVSLTVGDESTDSTLDICDEAASVDRALADSLTRDAIRRGLDTLPDEQRHILLLREINGLSYEEIAKVLALEKGTVKSRIFRARKKLCAFLLRDGNIPDEFASLYSEGIRKEVPEK